MGHQVNSDARVLRNVRLLNISMDREARPGHVFRSLSIAESMRWRVRRYGEKAHIERRGRPGTAFCGYGVRWVADHEAKQHVCGDCIRLWSEAMDA